MKLTVGHDEVASLGPQIETISETQVINRLRAVKVMRDSRGKALAFLTACSLVPAEDSEEEINKLRSELSSAAHRAYRITLRMRLRSVLKH